MPSHQKKSPKGSPPPGKLRIIGGRWRGRVLPFPEVGGLRPTGNRIRETLFNWLLPVLPGSRCLDLFAGSGALGLEALSRGAAHATLVEQHPAAAQQLRDNLLTLEGAEAAQVVHADGPAWLLGQAPAQKFDVVFLDPPFAANLWRPAALALEQGSWLTEQALIYVECPSPCQVSLPNNWQVYRHKRAGQVQYYLYQRQSESEVR